MILKICIGTYVCAFCILHLGRYMYNGCGGWYPKKGLQLNRVNTRQNAWYMEQLHDKLNFGEIFFFFFIANSMDDEFDMCILWDN